MREPFVYLRPEVTREDALAIIGWMEDEQVRRYLSDTQDASKHIQRAMDRIGLPVMTHLFSSGGRFFMVHEKKGGLVGFVRLVQNDEEVEIVIVIGDRKGWGKRLGTGAILESMRIAFFDMRTKKMTAKIHSENTRSIRAFFRAGFSICREVPGQKILQISMDEYMYRIHQGGICMEPKVILTEADRERLIKVISGSSSQGTFPNQAVQDLQREISRATVVDALQVPPNVITMNSRARIALDVEEMDVALVYPSDADWLGNKLSVLSPVGTALLGYSEGDHFHWEVPSGLARIQIKKVLYQPEAARDYHL